MKIDYIEETPFVSIVIPVKNEALVLERCLSSLAEVDYPKDRLEIIIADGHSEDDTREIAARFRVSVVTNDLEIVASGRNRGFEVSRGDIVAFTDADCLFDPFWIKGSVKYFADEQIGGVAGITLAPAMSLPFERAVDFIFHLSELINLTSHRTKKSYAHPVKDIPGCNAFYRREALLKVMPIDERLLTAEDVWMNYLIRRAGYKLLAVPESIIWHYRRNNPRKFIRQMYRFSIGRLQVAKRCPALLNPIHVLAGLAPFIFLAFLVFSYTSGILHLFLIMLLFFTALSLMCLFRTQSLKAGLWLPIVIVLFACSWSLGFLRELFFPMAKVKGR